MTFKEIKNIILLLIVSTIFIVAICFVVFCFSLGLYCLFHISPVLCVGGLCAGAVAGIILKNQIDL